MQPSRTYEIDELTCRTYDYQSYERIPFYISDMTSNNDVLNYYRTIQADVEANKYNFYFTIQNASLLELH